MALVEKGESTDRMAVATKYLGLILACSAAQEEAPKSKDFANSVCRPSQMPNLNKCVAVWNAAHGEADQVSLSSLMAVNTLWGFKVPEQQQAPAAPSGSCSGGAGTSCCRSHARRGAPNGSRGITEITVCCSLVAASTAGGGGGRRCPAP